MRAALVRAALVLALLTSATSAQAATGTFVAANCDPADAAGGQLFFNVRNSEGLFDARVGNSDCSDGRALLPAHNGHRGVADVSSDGRLVLLETALGPDRTRSWAEPGKGIGVQLQLLDRTTGALVQLTTGRKGIIWARFNEDVSKVAWAENELTPIESDWWNHYLGVWSLHVADLAGGLLYNEREWQHPTEPGFIEPYGWVPNTDRIIFASDSGARKAGMWWYGSQLWTIPDTLPAGESRTRISQPFLKRNWCFQTGNTPPSWCKPPVENAYHEFVSYHDGWLYTSIVRDATENGMDLWRMRPDGSGRERVSWFGGRPSGAGFEQVEGFPPPRYTVVLGGKAWIDGAWLTGVSGDADASTIDAYRIVP